MPFQVQWLVEKQVIYVHFWGELTVEDLRAEVAMGTQFIEASDRRLVHIIIDASDVTKSLALKDMASVMAGRKPHPRGGWTIMVGEQDKMMKFVSSVGRQLLKLRQRNYETLPEALQFLKDIDSAIDWSQANPAIVPDVETVAKTPSL